VSAAPAPFSASSRPPSGPPRGRSAPGAPEARGRLSASQWVRLSLLALALVVLGGATGYLAAGQLPEEYAAKADILYTVTREQPTGFLREDRNISTQLVMLESRTVLGPVADEWDVPVDRLAAAFSASVVEESEVISVQLTDGDPERAEDMLGSVLTRYLEVSPNDARAGVRDYLDLQLADVIDRIAAVPPAVADREGVLAPLTDREQWLRTRLDELQLTDLAGPAAEVLVPPYVGTEPVGPRPAVATAGGAFVGLVVAALLVAVLARRMTRPEGRRS
jgi:uncharacterized protein involved in exopolysaccharide biosynthesis